MGTGKKFSVKRDPGPRDGQRKRKRETRSSFSNGPNFPGLRFWICSFRCSSIGGPQEEPPASGLRGGDEGGGRSRAWSRARSRTRSRRADGRCQMPFPPVCSRGPCLSPPSPCERRLPGRGFRVPGHNGNNVPPAPSPPCLLLSILHRCSFLFPFLPSLPGHPVHGPTISCPSPGQPHPLGNITGERLRIHCDNNGRHEQHIK